MTQDSLHVLSLIISQSFVALWLLLGVEDTFGTQQEKIKGQKNRENNENNRLARRCSIVMCPVLTSSTPRSLPKYFYQGNNFYNFFFYNCYKSCYLGKIVSKIYGNCTVDFGMEVRQIRHAFPTAPIVAWYFPRTQPICCSPASVRENTNTILRTTW